MNDTQRQGKGHVPEFTFCELADQGVSWFAVVDADSTVEDDFLAHIRKAMHPKRQALQACYLSRPAHALKSHLARVAQFGLNRVRLLRGAAPIGLHPLSWVGTAAGATARALYLLATALCTPVTRGDLVIQTWARAYVLWTLTRFPLTLIKSRRHANWVRAERTTPSH